MEDLLVVEVFNSEQKGPNEVSRFFFSVATLLYDAIEEFSASDEFENHKVVRGAFIDFMQPKVYVRIEVE